jgi:hypothetical protein
MQSETVVGPFKASQNGLGIGGAHNKSRTNGIAIGNSRRCLQSESEQIRNRWSTQSIAHERKCDRKQSSVPPKQLLTDQESVAHSINRARTEMRSETVVGASKATPNGSGIGSALNQSRTNGNAIGNSRRCLQSESEQIRNRWRTQSIAHERNCDRKQSSVPSKQLLTDQESVAHSINCARTEMRSETVVGASKASQNGLGIGGALNQSHTNGNAIRNSRRCLQSNS